MSTVTEKDPASSGNKMILVLVGQRQHVESVQPVLDPDDGGSRHLEALRREYGAGQSSTYLKHLN